MRWSLVFVWSLMGCNAVNDDAPPFVDGDWRIERPADTTVVPGQLLEISLEDVDVDVTELRLWVDDHPDALSPRHVRPDPDGVTGHVLVRVAAPFLRAGEHELRFGANGVVRTGDLTLTVVVPLPRLPKAEVARLLARGVARIALDVQTVLADPDPTWQGLLARGVGPANLEAALDLLGGIDELVQLIETDYAAIPDEDEPAVQSVLEQVGLLATFEDFDAIEAASARRSALFAPSPLLDKLPHLAARGLFMLDAASLGVSVLNDAVTVFNVISLIVPGGQLLAVAGFEAQMVIHLVRYVVDNVIPTDLYELDPVMTQEHVYSVHHWLYWGVFRPENAGSGNITSLDDLLATLVGELAGGDAGGHVARVATDLAASIAAKLGLRIPGALVRFGPPPVPELKVVVNMQAYGLTLGDLATLVPFVGFLNRLFATVFFDVEVISPVEVTMGTPPWAADTRLTFDYADDQVVFDQTPWPENERLAGVIVDATAYRFTTEEYWVASLPKLELTTAVTDHWLHYSSDPLDPNENIQDRAFHITNVDDYDDYVTSETPSSRTVTIELRDLIGGLGNDACVIDVKVNGAVQHAGVALTGDSTSRTLTVQRGENLVQLVATQGHVIGYDTVGGNKSVALEVTFPDADQLDRSRGAYLNPGDTRDFPLVVSPPL